MGAMPPTCRPGLLQQPSTQTAKNADHEQHAECFTPVLRGIVVCDHTLAAWDDQGQAEPVGSTGTIAIDKVVTKPNMAVIMPQTLHPNAITQVLSYLSPRMPLIGELSACTKARAKVSAPNSVGETNSDLPINR
eukprot:CAMPEP_0177772612 /NCGR_PEP_ID=MMETSP0491_2-20121128/12343_1 /TAXON_ID=63592 /ORGANISM="Tetraselmis chuii, Strain PLY429" /LENGTH=133 /DNA_ID=CAMNT_0019290489 /DNA_START=550 /DNA_END=953 /DNA_ORIENTATION=-